MTLEDEIAEKVAREMSNEIDFEIMRELLVESGWYVIELLTLGSRERSIDIQDWVTKNCKRGFIASGRTFVFKCKQEAEWFSLRWL
jgi:hypothetical protein